MRRGYYDHHKWDPFRPMPRPEDPAALSWYRWTPFEKCCWYWAAVNAFAADFAAARPDRCLTLHVERLFAGEAAAVREVYDFIGVPPPPPAVQGASLSEPKNAQTWGGDFPPFERWDPERVDTLRRIAGDVAARVGYDLSAKPGGVAGADGVTGPGGAAG